MARENNEYLRITASPCRAERSGDPTKAGLYDGGGFVQPVDQAISCGGRGDCMRATLASLLGLELEAVPHFILLPERLWNYVFSMFLWALGWSYEGCMSYSKTEPNNLCLEDSFDGYFYATVPSRNFEGKTHAVVMDMNGVVVHDPSPTKKYQGENVIETGCIEYWYLVKRRDDDEWKSWQSK